MFCLSSLSWNLIKACGYINHHINAVKRVPFCCSSFINSLSDVTKVTGAKILKLTVIILPSNP